MNNSVLLIIDIQNDYFPDGAMELVGSIAASENAKLILEKFRKENRPIVHIQHIATNPAATFFLSDTYGAEIHKNVKPVGNEKIIVKHYPNSFRDTELLEYLKTHNLSNLVICGMMTHMCVDATTRAAKDYGFECCLIGDACATRDLEVGNEIVIAQEVQKAFLGALSYYYSKIVTTKEFLKSSQ